VRRTWAPRGQTPQLRHSYRHDRISAVSAISVSPRRRRVNLYYQLHTHNIRRREVCRFVSHLLRHLRGPIVLLWDNIATHRGGPIEKLCRRNPRLRIEPFPAYAPELNPDEGVWQICKALLANGQPEDLDRLWGDLVLTLEQLRDHPAKLRSCVQQSELPPFLR
jgi:transposase